MKVQVSITLDKDLIDKIDELRKYFDQRLDITVSRSQLIEKAIRSYLKQIDFEKLEKQDEIIDRVLAK